MQDWRPKPIGSTAADSSADDLPMTYTMTMYDREEASETSEVSTCKLVESLYPQQ